jgi:hypothetical protein
VDHTGSFGLPGPARTRVGEDSLVSVRVAEPEDAVTGRGWVVARGIVSEGNWTIADEILSSNNYN